LQSKEQGTWQSIIGISKLDLDNKVSAEAQNVPLNMRLQLLESFLDVSPPIQNKAVSGNFRYLEVRRGSLTIVDLSCPLWARTRRVLVQAFVWMFLENRMERWEGRGT